MPPRTAAVQDPAVVRTILAHVDPALSTESPCPIEDEMKRRFEVA
jgi:hypothetical protein